VIVAYLVVVYQKLLGETEGRHGEMSVMLFADTAEMRNTNLPITRQEGANRLGALHIVSRTLSRYKVEAYEKKKKEKKNYS
jgi:hypothetical protein